MAATTQRQQPQAQTTQAEAPDPARLLEQILARAPSQRYRVVDDALMARVSKVEELLPDQLKGQGARLVKRAMLTFSRKPELERCSPASFIRCVLEAAELGLAIDGKLAHAVPFKTEAQLIVDYKGLIAVARRGGLIADCRSDVIREGDEFRAVRENEKDLLHHERRLTGGPQKVLGAYALLSLSGGLTHFELMDVADLDRIRRKSKAANNGPWVSDTNEMYRKTVVKRALKYFSEDPAMVRALEIDDREYEEPETPATNGAATLPQGRQSLRAPAPVDVPADDLPPAEPAEPTREDNLAELDRRDLVEDLAGRIKEAETAQRLGELLQETIEKQDFLGAFAAGALREALAARRKELGLDEGGDE